MSETISSGLTLIIPSTGEKNWGSTFKSSFATPISSHAHTGGGDGNKIAQTGLNATLISSIQDDSWTWLGTAGGTANALTGSASPAITAYADGQKFTILAASTNTNTATLAVNGLSAKAIVKMNGLALAAGEIIQNILYTVVYDGTSFRLMGYYSPHLLATFSSSSISAGGSGTLSVAGGNTDGVPVPTRGHVARLSFIVTSTVSVGTLTLTPKKNGSSITTGVLSAGKTFAGAMTSTVDTADVLTIDWSASAGYNGGANVIAYLWGI